MAIYTQEQMRAAADEIDKQTDRGAAIVAATVLDNILENLIAARLIIPSPKHKKALFGQYAPLSSFSAKIELGFALGLYDTERRASLDLIRDVRNKFAHRLEATGFDNPKIAAIIEAGITQKVRDYTHLSIRQKFLFTCNILIAFLGLTASFPQVQLKALADDPAFHQHFDAVFAAIRHYFEQVARPTPKTSSSS
jgi:hypothetical protein